MQVQNKLKTTSVECYVPEEDCWHACAPLPRPMMVACVAAGRFIYVLPSGDDAMLRYDPATDRFDEVGHLPLPNYHCFAVAAHPGAPEKGGADYFYVVGGATNGACNANRRGMLNPHIPHAYQCMPGAETLAWCAARLSSHGNDRAQLNSAHLTGRWSSKAFRYDCGESRWEELPEMKTARRRTAATVMHAV